jgi:hypothetical protein
LMAVRISRSIPFCRTVICWFKELGFWVPPESM